MTSTEQKRAWNARLHQVQQVSPSRFWRSPRHGLLRPMSFRQYSGGLVLAVLVACGTAPT